MKKVIRVFPIVISGVYASSIGIAHGQSQLPTVQITASGDDTNGYEATQTSVATKVAAPLRDVPQTVNVVTRALLRDQNATSMQDALSNVAGVGLSVGDAQRDQVSIRGFSAITDQFIDGVRDDALYYRDLSNTERIEILKGPASVLYGRGSAGGIVNRVSKKPAEEPVKEVATTLGNYGQKRGEFDIGSASEDKTVLFRLTGAVEDSTSFRKLYFLERQAIAPSITFKLQTDTTLTLQADYLKDKRLADQGVPSFRGAPVDVSVGTYYGAANGRDRAYVQSEVSSGTATFDHRIAPHLQWHSVLRSYDYALDRNYTTISSVSNGSNPTVVIAQNRRLRNETGVFWQNELIHKVQWGSVQSQWLYGLELGAQDKSEKLSTRANAATYSLFNPVLVDLPVMPANIVPTANNKSRVSIAGLYTQALVTLNPQWKLTAGARFDRLNQLRDDLTSSNRDLSRQDNTLSPRLGAVYQPNQHLSLYASYNKSFQPLSDAFTFYTNSDKLSPTETVNKEVGAKWDIANSASLAVSLFEMTQSNIHVADPANTTVALQVGKQRTQGLEVSLNGNFNTVWDVTASYAYMDGQIIEAAQAQFRDKTASLTPKHGLNLWVKRKLPEGYYVAAGARAETERYASADNRTVLGGYEVVNLGAGYESKKYDVNLTLKNLLDRKYFVSAHGAANDYNMPGEPQSLVLSVRYRL
nr:TonB-dependent siderophore receptor [uncultured Rhodoferax sp.]